MTNFSKSVPKVPNSGGKTGGRFSRRAKKESYQRQKQLMANDIIAREEKNTKRSYKKNQALGRY